MAEGGISDSNDKLIACRWRELFDFCLMREAYRKYEWHTEVAFPREMNALLLLLGRYPRVVALGLQFFRSMRVIWGQESSYDRSSVLKTILKPLSPELSSPPSQEVDREFLEANLRRRNDDQRKSDGTHEKYMVGLRFSDCPTTSERCFWPSVLGRAGYADDGIRERKEGRVIVLDDERLTSLFAWLWGAISTGQRDATVVCLSTLPSKLFSSRGSCSQEVTVDLVKRTAIRGLVEEITLLHRLGADIDHHSKDGMNPLWYAARFGHPKVIQALHSFGASLNAKNKKGETVLKVGSEYPEVVKVLHSLGVPIDITLATTAAANGNKGTLELLQSLGVDLTAYDRGWTCLHYAAACGQPEIVKLLHSVGADVNALNEDGASPVFLAAESDDHGSSEVIRVLHSLGADINAPNRDGLAPLAVADEKGTKAVKVLNSLGAQY